MTFTDAVYEAVRIPNPDDSRAAVHETVGRELHRLDPSIGIKSTQHFNHSFVPDFVLSWGAQNERVERELYLRLTVSSTAFQETLTLLEADRPMFLGVFDEKSVDQFGWSAREEVSQGSLVTQARAIQRLDENIERDGRTQIATRGLVRGGRGIVDGQKAENLGARFRSATSALDRLTPETLGDARVSMTEALTSLREVLSEAGSIELEQTLQALWIRSGGDPFQFPAEHPWDPAQLSREALSRVLNDLISSGQSMPEETWLRLAGHLTAEEIGRVLGRPIYGGNLNHLVAALLPQWTAQWLWVDEKETPPLIFDEFAWLIDGELLGLDAGEVRLFFADDGRHFKDKPQDMPSPSLRETRELLSHRDVVGVSLRTVGESVDFALVEQTEGRSLGDAVDQLLSEPESARYGVRAVTAQVPGRDQTAQVLYDERKIDFRKVPTPLSTVARMGYRFFSSREAEPSAAFETFLSRSAETEAPAGRLGGGEEEGGAPSSGS